MRRWSRASAVVGAVALLQGPAFAELAEPTPAPMCQTPGDLPGRVQASLVLGDTVYFSGKFTSVLPPGGGTAVPRGHLAACSLSTGAVLPWDPGADDDVTALATDGRVIYAGGSFSHVGGQVRSRLVALDPNPNGATVLPWAPDVSGGGIRALALSGTTLYLGGDFTAVHGQGRSGLAAVDGADGSPAGLRPWAPVLTQEAPQPDGTVRAIEVRGLVVAPGKVVAGGIFADHLSAFEPTSGAPLPWRGALRDIVLSMSASENRLYAAGAGPGGFVRAFDLTDGDEQWAVRTDGNVQAVLASGGVVYAGGHFENVTRPVSVARNRLLALAPDTGRLLGWGPQTDQVGQGVYSLQAGPTSLVVGGEFQHIAGARQQGLARFPVPLPPPGPGVPPPPPVPVQPGGYRLVGSDGGVFAFGDATFKGSTGAIRLNQPIVGMAATPSGQGYWLVASDGGIFAFGDATFKGSLGNLRLNRPIVGMAASPTGLGYRLVASDGGIFSFGDAPFRGSIANFTLNRPIVGMAATPSGQGYRVVASDGGIFAFGDATFKGSTGAIRLNQPIVGIASTPSGQGYWMVAADGGIFAFGDAAFKGSTGAIRLNRPIVGMAATPSGQGYWLVAADGGIFAFGDAAFKGSTGAIRLNRPIVGMARS